MNMNILLKKSFCLALWGLYLLLFFDFGAQFSWAFEIKKISPNGIAVDSSENVYISDVANYRIWKISSKGVMSILAGSGLPGYANGTGTTASFLHPSELAVDSKGNVYVIDKALIRKITSGGVVSTFKSIESEVDPNKRLNNPLMGIAVDTTGNVYVMDWYEDGQIRKISPEGVMSTLPNRGNAPAGHATMFNMPFQSPIGIAVDTSGNVYVADTWNDVIRKVTTKDVVETLAGSDKLQFVREPSKGFETAKNFEFTWGIAVDSSENIYLSEIGEILKITQEGVLTTIAGQFRTSGLKNGKGSDALFHGPKSVAVDSFGNVYVVDAGNNLIRKINKLGVVTTLSASVTMNSTN